jgi:hypothetical protein
MRTGGPIHSANANHSHPVTALGVGQVSAAAARSQPRAIYSGGARATIPMFEAMPTRCRVSGWRACFDSTVDAAGTCLPSGSLGVAATASMRASLRSGRTHARPTGVTHSMGCSRCTLGYARVLLGCSSGTLPCSDRTRSQSPRATPTATLRSTRSRRRRARRVYRRGPHAAKGSAGGSERGLPAATSAPGLGFWMAISRKQGPVCVTPSPSRRKDRGGGSLCRPYPCRP